MCMPLPSPTPYHLGPEAGHAFWCAGALLTVKAAGAETGGRFWLLEVLAARGQITPLHTHQREDQAWYVLDGELRCRLGERTIRAPRATFVYLPRGVPHSLVVETPVARLLVLGSPAGAERFFWDAGEPARALTLPPPARPPDAARLRAAWAAYGVDVAESSETPWRDRWARSSTQPAAR